MKTFGISAAVVFFASVCVALAAAANFSGSWDTTWNSGTKATRLDVTQAGTKITGKYTSQGGAISGQVEDNVATGTWWQKDGAQGHFRFVLSPDGASFKGQWKNSGSREWQGTWNGVLR